MVDVTLRSSTTAPLSYDTIDENFTNLKTAIEAVTSPLENFTDLTDTPVSYAGHANKLVTVKATEDRLEFTAAGSPSDHGGLTGLADDDHAQYHNNTRGDARYELKTWSKVSSNTNAVVFTNYRCDTSGGIFTLTLPASPSNNDIVRVADAEGTFATNNLTVARNTKNIVGLAENLTCDLNHAAFGLIYDSTQTSWYFI